MHLLNRRNSMKPVKQFHGVSFLRELFDIIKLRFQFLLILIICILRNPCHLHDFHVRLIPVEIRRMLLNDSLDLHRFLGGALLSGTGTDLLSVQSCCYNAFPCSLPDIFVLLFCLL